ncbi:MAG: hypothetical protein ABSA53_32530 [Streptosporangiaceae bacterium]
MIEGDNAPGDLQLAGFGVRSQDFLDHSFARVSVPVSDSDVLRDLLLAEKPGTVIEIGLAYGSSALAIAEALVAAGPDQARHVIIDALHAHGQVA